MWVDHTEGVPNDLLGEISIFFFSIFYLAGFFSKNRIEICMAFQMFWAFLEFYTNKTHATIIVFQLEQALELLDRIFEYSDSPIVLMQ